MNSIDTLRDLVAFQTVSRDSNLDLVGYVADVLDRHAIAFRLIYDRAHKKANLLATVGPADVPGVVLSGHTDVVPVDGQDWTVPPFQLTDLGGRLYGRGTTDMKGFIACALGAIVTASKMDLNVPLHLALSYDEELGCLGVHDLIETMAGLRLAPRLVIVGEPTELAVATGHKGKIGAHVVCRGRESHSALAPQALNAIHLATDFVAALRAEQDRLCNSGARDGDYDVPYSTVHVGKIKGGVALNIVPNLCELDFEIRNVAADDPLNILARLRRSSEAIVEKGSHVAPVAAIDIDIFNSYPGLDTPIDSAAVAFVKSLTGAKGTRKVAFGTEGGLFSRDLGVPAVICGPGSMAQGHGPDEFITLEQLYRCDDMLAKLLVRLAGEPADVGI